MTTPADTIAKLADVWSSITELCDGLSDEQWALATDCPGWTVQDHLSHLIGFERVLNGRPATEHRAERPEWVRNDIGAANEHEVDVRRALPGAAVLAEFREVADARLAQLRATPADDFAKESWTPIGPGTLLDLLQIRVLDCYVHEQDMRRALDLPGHLDGPVAEHTVDRLWRTLPATVGRRAGAPEGSTVVAELTGPVKRLSAIGVTSGRASVLDVVPPEPTVYLGMASDTFLIMATGRREPDDLEVTVEGDETLGDAILAKLNTMI